VLLPQEAPEQQLGSAADPAQLLNATQQAVVGLTNLGNTCFFNSSVQLLLACAPLQLMLQQKEHDITRGPLGFALQQALLHASGG
jgi:ubiquitin C-terminal hydrolase